jgi:EAL domain-containing protein (putative c-di-GMP-specific phosphodiesterase class I)/GGDEF domain-containing protein
MQVQYNVDFLVAALVILLVVLYDFINRHGPRQGTIRYFRLYLCLGIGDVVLDLIARKLLMDGGANTARLTMAVMTLLYLFQTVVPVALYWYTRSLDEETPHNDRRDVVLCQLPALLMALVVVTNVRTGVLFSIAADGTYTEGPGRLLMSGYALAYVLLILVRSLYRRKRLGAGKLGVVFEFLAIMTPCVILQAWMPTMRVTGFGLGLGVMLLYLTTSNPAEYMDQVTEISNLLSFRAWSAAELEKQRPFHVLTVNLRQLRRANLVFGREFGDSFLRQVAERLQEILGTPYVFRISSKNFVLVTRTLDEYERVRREVLAFVNEELTVGDVALTLVTVVCGIPDAGQMGDCDTLLGYIDYLVSLAPKAEENFVVQSDEKTLQGFNYYEEIERYLRVAVQEDLFEVYYQPVYSVEQGGYVTLEALSRLRHPTLGPVSPEVFIGIAERNGQIMELGYLQFRRVCRFISEHRELIDKLHNIKFNLSPAEILKNGYSERLIDVVKEFDLPYSFFQFEITETVATEYSERLYQVVGEFVSCGIGLSMDDFGSGYANFDAVLKLPFSTIKLDRSLLHGILEDEKTMTFYHSVVNILQSMGYTVVAEGVETAEEMNLLLSWGVDMIQGFYFSKPVCQEDLLKLLGEEAPQK